MYFSMFCRAKEQSPVTECAGAEGFLHIQRLSCRLQDKCVLIATTIMLQVLLATFTSGAELQAPGISPIKQMLTSSRKGHSLFMSPSFS
jgi:hypothetical protein